MGAGITEASESKWTDIDEGKTDGEGGHEPAALALVATERAKKFISRAQPALAACCNLAVRRQSPHRDAAPTACVPRTVLCCLCCRVVDTPRLRSSYRRRCRSLCWGMVLLLCVNLNACTRRWDEATPPYTTCCEAARRTWRSPC
jgi:hypothetical protein